MTQPDTTIPSPTPLDAAMSIHAHWQQMAHDKGFRITGRDKDLARVVLQCQTCGQDHDKRHSVVTGSTPLCPHCVEGRWKADAAAAGLEWQGRDRHDRKRGRYRAPCGHVVSRQFELIKRIAAGTCALRCETCQRAKEAAEARIAGWTLLGPARAYNSNYRRYRHGCGHEQEIALCNMRSERVSCAGCGVRWSAAPSSIYLMRFTLPAGPGMVKLGYSLNPRSRLRHQLMCSPEIGGTLLRTVAVSTGREALRLEKRMHRALKRAHPGAVVPHETYRDHLRVKSEIYAATLAPEILQMLDALADGAPVPD
ncbi:hypothetical protein OCH239_22335 [Roseivivax halodurans JCM 10272]|uniref:Uncharacterized protein n=1 Tax=Roseivivax halodurans JCM 10272 TaxID=1449350 RepID=X7E4Y7_9RHOB|nr:hypothetical protein [Roseivivax halodurans]ETX10241.1 hypothetical protein OCH239_22335 [Roseivivax halodurans JCM 10272]